jgi:hypothetical protein
MAKSVRPCRVGQQPPEVRCWIFDGPACSLGFVAVKGTERSVANLKLEF